MHEIKDILMGEIHKVKGDLKKSNGGKISRSDMEWLKDLTEVVKNIDKIEILEEGDGYSEESNWMADGRMYGTSYDDGMSYARGRGRNAKRDSMGRYSRDMMHHDDMSYENGASYARGDRSGRRGGYSRADAKEQMIEKLEDMMQDAETSKEREAIKRCIMQIEND